MLQQLRHHAYTRSPFYQRYHSGLEQAPLHKLPVLTKAMLMEHFDELVTNRQVRRTDVEAHLKRDLRRERYLGRYWLNATSGSTGRPGLFLFDAAEWATIIASYARASDWTGLKAGLTHRRKFAIVSSTTEWHQSAAVGATIESPWFPTLRIDSGEPMPEIVSKLNKWQPEMLTAYASMAHLLAEEQLAGRLHITPAAVTAASEVLTSVMRARIELAWGRKLFNVYGATETSCIASECDHHSGLHLYEDLVIVEAVDGDNQPVPAARYADKLLVTVLFSRTMPLIRYEISDSVKLADASCRCAMPYGLIESIQGRVEEVMHLRNDRGEQVTVQPIVFHRIMEAVMAAEWQVIQTEGGLEVLIGGAREGFSAEALAGELQHELSAQGVAQLPIKVMQVEAIPRNALGKAPLIKAARKPS
ncbi:MAG: phenylacetate--CoA ligase family protein [Chloroflexia bacterium]